MIGTTFFLCCLGFMNSIDAPVCVVKRFRRHVPAALETPPAPDSQHGLSTGSFELVTGGADSPEALSWPDQDALSSIDPVDLFAAESNPDVAFQPRWTEFGSYDFNYRSWEYHRPSKSVLDSIADLSYDTTVLWRSELYAAALFLDDFAAELESKGQHAVWGTIRHAADGTRDLYDLVGVHISRVSPLPGP